MQRIILPRPAAVVVGGGSWVPNITSPTFSAENTGWTGYTIRCRIEAAQITNTGLSQVRVTFRSAVGAGCKITKATIGNAAGAGDAYDFAATPTQLLFGGSASTTWAADADKLSDAATFTIGAGAVIVAAYFDDGAADDVRASNSSAATGFRHYYKLADDTTTVDATGYTAGAADTALFVKLIESL